MVPDTTEKLCQEGHVSPPALCQVYPYPITINLFKPALQGWIIITMPKATVADKHLN